MAVFIQARTITQGWMDAVRHLLDGTGRESNLIVAVAAPTGAAREIMSVRGVLDQFFAEHETRQIRSIRKVADTLFPIDFYRAGPGEAARERLYRFQRRASKVERRCIPRGTYFDRLMDWPGGSGNESELERNQLERCVRRLKSSWNQGIRNLSATELALTFGQPDGEEAPDGDVAAGGPAADLRIYDALMDRNPRAFPCLSHVSVTLFAGRIDLTATYRSQHFFTKAYGNYVGLADLQAFIAAEVGAEVGELVCVSTNAALGLATGIGKRDLRDVLEKCRAAARPGGGDGK
jgi:hypothetical protein